MLSLQPPLTTTNRDNAAPSPPNWRKFFYGDFRHCTVQTGHFQNRQRACWLPRSSLSMEVSLPGRVNWPSKVSFSGVARSAKCCKKDESCPGKIKMWDGFWMSLHSRGRWKHKECQIEASDWGSARTPAPYTSVRQALLSWERARNYLL